MLIWSVAGRGPSMVEAQWSTVVAGGFVVVDGPGSTLPPSRLKTLDSKVALSAKSIAEVYNGSSYKS